MSEDNAVVPPLFSRLIGNLTLAAETPGLMKGQRAESLPRMASAENETRRAHDESSGNYMVCVS